MSESTGDTRRVEMICVQDCLCRGSSYNIGQSIFVTKGVMKAEKALGRHKETGNPISPLYNHFRSSIGGVRKCLRDEGNVKFEFADEMNDGLAEKSRSYLGMKRRRRVADEKVLPGLEASDAEAEAPGLESDVEESDEDTPEDAPETVTEADALDYKGMTAAQLRDELHAKQITFGQRDNKETLLNKLTGKG